MLLLSAARARCKQLFQKTKKQRVIKYYYKPKVQEKSWKVGLLNVTMTFDIIREAEIVSLVTSKVYPMISCISKFNSGLHKINLNILFHALTVL